MTKTILVTGASGFIGSHTCVELLAAGFDVVAVDNLCNSAREAMARVERIAGTSVPFYAADVRDRAAMAAILREHAIDAVIHFAGLKSVGESVAQPLRYMDNNVTGTVALLEVLAAANVKRFVFSSSATVYGDPEALPIVETSRLSVTNPYGRSKLMVEQILADLVHADAQWQIGVLRYFNPVGAHESGLIGEDPNGIPNNLLPYISQVGVGKLKELGVFGNDYPTPDGTGVRDYIHVVDLALGHLKALARIAADTGVFTYNLGTGQGYSVLQMIRAFEAASGSTIAYQIKPRRPGDIAECWAEPHKARDELGWQAERGLEQMMADTWRWQSQNPNGYGPAAKP